MSSDLDFQDFASANPMTGLCQPIQAGSIKKGSFCMLKGNPCKVLETAVSKPGKHGSAKLHAVGVDIFTDKKYDDIFGTSSTAWAPIVEKTQFQVANIDQDGFVSLLNKDSTLKENLRLPTDEQLREVLKRCWEDYNETAQIYFNVISSCGKEKIVSCRAKDF